MTSFVIADRSFVSEALRSAHKALPAAVRRLIRGAVDTVALADTSDGRRYRPLQRVDVLVPADMVLRRRIVVPAKARKEIGHAVELFIRTETPFSPEDVLAHAREEAARPADQQVAYAVRLLPRATLRQALATRKLHVRQVDRVVLDGVADVDFAPALFPARRFLRWLPAIPIVVILTAVAWHGLGDLSQRQSRIAELEDRVAATLVRVKALTGDIEAARQQASGTLAVLKLLSDTPSAVATLEAIRRSLPAGTEVLRLDLRGSEVRLAVRSPNALADAQALSVAPAPWAGSIEGPITADPGSSLEMATILLRPRPMRTN